MESATKNKKTTEEIEKMAFLAFKEGVKEVSELKEGYFNAAYLVTLDSGLKTVLKVAPKVDVEVMSYEKNIMKAEVFSMKLVKEKTEVPVPEIFFYDESKMVSEEPYFFMEYLTGESLSEKGKSLSEEEIRFFHEKVGYFNHLMNEIKVESFGYPGQEDMLDSSWFHVFTKMISMGIQDAEKKNIDLRINTDELFQYLLEDESYFKEVTVPHLIHWDIWDGNVFIKDKEVVGFIDFERAIFGDPLLEVGFRQNRDQSDFLKGYGKEEFTQSEQRRRLWYDIYYFILLSIETEYRQYETDDMYKWATRELEKCLSLRREG